MNGDVMVTLSKLFITFIIYSFVGYIAEVILVSVEFKKLTNRGFLCGPICPIYGIGAVLMGIFLKKYEHDALALFCLGAILASIIEYMTGWVLEKVFHNKWWDYSKHKFNINGRVCMSNAILFGLGAVVVVMFVNPFISNLLSKISNKLIIIVASITFLIFILDLIYSWIVAFNLRHNIIIVEDLKNSKIGNIPEKVEAVLSKQIKNIKRIPKRISQTFPKFIGNYKIEFDIINKLKKEKKEKDKKKKKNK